jgi:hypothetical protein
MNHVQFAPTGRVITIPYIYQANNYILKIKSDLAFINYTKAKNYFHFTNKTDPFLLFTTQHLQQYFYYYYHQHYYYIYNIIVIIIILSLLS